MGDQLIVSYPLSQYSTYKVNANIPLDQDSNTIVVFLDVIHRPIVLYLKPTAFWTLDSVSVFR
jgi:hypothetical protein